MEVKNIDSLTPVQEYNNILFKRDDLFSPFDNGMVNGSKLRQCLKLVGKLQTEIKNTYNNKIATSCNLKSPQGLIVASVAKYYNIDCMVGYANTKGLKAVVNKNTNIQRILDTGSDVRIIAKMGLETNMQKKLKEIINSGEDNFYIIKFGMNASLHHECIIDPISRQVINLPDADNIVITVGSGLSCAAILTGIIKHKKNIKNVYCVQPFGYDRMKLIDSIIPFASSYFNSFQFVTLNESYTKEEKISITENFELDKIYEAKVYKWLQVNKLKGTTIFYVIGNSNYANN